MKTKTTNELKVIRNTSTVKAYREMAEAELEARRPAVEVDMLALLIG